jgi:hypothetical protein
MDRGRMWERGGGYERVEVRREEVRKCHESDVPPFLFPYLHNQLRPTCLRTHSQTSVPFKIPFVFRTKRHLGPDGFVLT